MSDSQLQAPTNGAEQRLDLLLEELRGIRLALHEGLARPAEPPLEPAAISREIAPREPRVLGRARRAP